MSLTVLNPGVSSAPAGGGDSASLQRYSLDFTSVTGGTQTLTGDGSHSFLDLTWTKRGSAQEASAMTVDASGLTMKPGPNGDFVNADRTAPHLTTPLLGIVGSSTRLFGANIRIYLRHVNPAASGYDLFLFGLTHPTTSAFSYIAKIGYGGVGIGSALDMIRDGSSPQPWQAHAIDEIFMLEIPTWPSRHGRLYRGGAWAGAWPDDASLVPIYDYMAGAGDIRNGFSLANVALVLGAFRAGSGNTNFRPIVKQVQIEVRA